MNRLILVLFIFLAFNANAQVIHSIVVQGTERVEDDTVKSYLDIIPGVNFGNDQIDASLKKLYASNLFQKVEIIPQGDKLYVELVENPKINLLVFEGNSKMKTKELEDEIMLRSRMIYTKAKVQDDVNRITDLYRKNGRFSAKVIPQIITLPQNRVNLIFKIEEGPVAKIGKVIFVDNKAFSNSTLRSELSSKETRWYYFLSSSDQFNPSRLEYDRELLTRFYNSRGYADFRIISVITNVSENNERFYITVTVDEGLKYNFGKIEIDSSLKSDSINVEQMRSMLTTKEKAVYDIRKIEKSQDLLIKKINDEGYAFVDINPQMRLNQESKTVDITYFIAEARKTYVNRINILGNGRTIDRVIRREFRLAEGDAYNSTKIQRSEQRINNLDYFEKATIETEVTDQPDKVDLTVKLQEKSTAGLNFAAGYSTGDGILGKVGLTERNFLGKGQEVAVSIGKSAKRWDLDASFTEPYLFDRPISGTIAGFTRKFDKDEKHYRRYDHSSDGMVLSAGYDLTEYLHHSVHYSLTKNKITNIADTASIYIQEQKGTRISSMVGQNFTYDKRDSTISPTSGYILSLGQDVAGLGGNTKFLKHEVKGRYYYPIYNDDVILMVSGEAGEIHGFGGKKVNLVDRFFLGGADNLRGFDFSGVGPRAKGGDNESLGGNIYYTTTTEVKFPLGVGKDFGLFGSVFVDAGSLYKVDVDQKSQIYDSKKLRSSYGVSVGFMSPMGPIKIHYARPISKAVFDKIKYFDISFSTNF